MNIVVTGANGLVGSHLIQYSGHRFYAVTRRPPPEGVTWLQADVSTDFDTSNFPHAVDAVVCLAQSNRYRDLPDGAADLIAVNVAGVTRMLQYAAGLDPAPHVILASTGDVYGRSTGEPFRENDPFFQNVEPGLYPLSRKIAEDYARTFATTYGLRLSIVRLFHIYGRGMPTNALIHRLRESVVDEKTIRLNGESGIFINPTYVTDVADAILKIAAETAPVERQQVEVYNVAAEKSYSLREIAAIIGQHVGKSPRFEIVEASPAPYITPSIEKLKAHYGIADTIPFEEGFKLLSSKHNS